jgi:hypothetical protein
MVTWYFFTKNFLFSLLTATPIAGRTHLEKERDLKATKEILSENKCSLVHKNINASQTKIVKLLIDIK